MRRVLWCAWCAVASAASARLQRAARGSSKFARRYAKSGTPADYLTKRLGLRPIELRALAETHPRALSTRLDVLAWRLDAAAVAFEGVRGEAPSEAQLREFVLSAPGALDARGADADDVQAAAGDPNRSVDRVDAIRRGCDGPPLGGAL